MLLQQIGQGGVLDPVPEAFLPLDVAGMSEHLAVLAAPDGLIKGQAKRTQPAMPCGSCMMSLVVQVLFCDWGEP